MVLKKIEFAAVSISTPPDTRERNGILFPKLFWPTLREKCSGDQEKLLKCEDEDQEFA